MTREEREQIKTLIRSNTYNEMNPLGFDADGFIDDLYSAGYRLMPELKPISEEQMAKVVKPHQMGEVYLRGDHFAVRNAQLAADRATLEGKK